MPKAVREVLGLHAGDRIRYTVKDGMAHIRPLRPIRRLRGLVQHRGPAVSLEAMDRAIAKGACGD